jgi:hypothetical protein
MQRSEILWKEGAITCALSTTTTPVVLKLSNGERPLFEVKIESREEAEMQAAALRRDMRRQLAEQNIWVRG